MAPTFRWSLVAFVLVVAAVLVLSVALLVLLDPRSQQWWGERFADLAAALRSLLRGLQGR